MKVNYQNLRINKSIRIHLFLLLMISYSCGQKQQENNIEENKKTTLLNHDSLVEEIFHFSEQYFKVHSIEKLVTLKGKPIDIQKEEWGYGQESMLVVSYPFLTFNFLGNPDSSLELERICLLDNNVTLAGGISIGKSTQQDIIQKLGLLKDVDINTQTTGDTVTFYYDINIDEYAIGFLTIKDTLRKISWIKNMN